MKLTDNAVGGLDYNSASDINSGYCQDFMVLLADELKKAGVKDVEYVLLSTDRFDLAWAHCLVYDKKTGAYVDAEGWSNGNHVIDNDVYCDALTSDGNDFDDFILHHRGDNLKNIMSNSDRDKLISSKGASSKMKGLHGSVMKVSEAYLKARG